MMNAFDPTQDRRAFLRTAMGLAAGASAWPMLAAASGVAGAADAASGTSSSSAPALQGGTRRSVIIDCDPGQDDAIAILFALGVYTAVMAVTA